VTGAAVEEAGWFGRTMDRFKLMMRDDDK